MFTSKMKRVVVILAVVAIANLMATGPIHATPIADSVADFSGIQGTNGWSYGEWNSPPALSTINDYAAGSYVNLPYYGAAFWDGPSWMRGPAGTESWPILNAERTQSRPPDMNGWGLPGGWSVRRWISDYTGPVTISGVVQRVEGVGGDGMQISIMKNATTSATTDTLFSTFYASDANVEHLYSFTTSVTAGDTIDFVADPVGDISNDRSKFTATIVPEPSTLALLGTALLGLLAYAWRKRR